MLFSGSCDLEFIHSTWITTTCCLNAFLTKHSREVQVLRFGLWSDANAQEDLIILPELPLSITETLSLPMNKLGQCCWDVHFGYQYQLWLLDFIAITLALDFVSLHQTYLLKVVVEESDEGLLGLGVHDKLLRLKFKQVIHIVQFVDLLTCRASLQKIKVIRHG